MSKYTDIDDLIEESVVNTKSDNRLVHIAWLIKGLDLGNYTLEQTQRYVLSQVIELLKAPDTHKRKEKQDAKRV